MANGYIDALRQAQKTIGTLKQALFGVIALGVVGMLIARQLPVNLSIHPAPNMRAGDVIEVKGGVAPVPSPNVYGFAIYIWQQINRWSTDGSTDYGSQLFTFQNYLTPGCQQQIKADIELRSAAGELSQRTRSLGEIPGQVFTEERVIAQGEYAWTVLLDLQLQETVRGTPVKDAFIRYPLRVVRYDVDREKNLWGLALDCYGDQRPQRLDPAEVKAAVAQRGVAKAKNEPQPPSETSIQHRPPVQIGNEAASAAASGAASTVPAPAILPQVRSESIN